MIPVEKPKLRASRGSNARVIVEWTPLLFTSFDDISIRYANHLYFVPVGGSFDNPTADFCIHDDTSQNLVERVL